MKKLSLTLSKNSLLTINKNFDRANLDYAGIVYKKCLTDSFKNKLEIQCSSRY